MTGVDGLDLQQIPTPYYLVDEKLLTRNLEILKSVADRTGCRILLAQKAFSMFYFYPLIGKYLHGTTASGLFEARLGFEEMGNAKCENHIFSPAYRESEFDEILEVCDHLSFNSFAQWERFKTRALASGRQCGIRINPECSTQEHGIYDPCSPGSRLGVPIGQFREDLLEGISGLHFHTLCEQNADALVMTLETVETNFGKYLYQMKWLNIGGGHHITRSDYDIELLIRTINHISDKYDVQIYIEPGEAVALNAGYLVSEVADLLHNDVDIAVMDASAACHMPDVLEMPYRPKIIGSGEPSEKAFTYRLGGPTCLAGDIIGDYSFDEPLKPGDRLVFCDMAIYSMVKNNTFNGIGLPSIAVINKDREIRLIKKFGYEDFKERLS
jgi:carboxynorspermidine decarboxylase